MIDKTVWTPLLAELDRFQAAGRTAPFWLRDDDAVEPGAALDQLLALTARHGVPVTLAVIPQNTGAALVARLGAEPEASVAVHGWSHVNHAGPAKKKCELGLDRPAEVVLAELQAGFDHLQKLFGAKFVALLVPPWNRIDPALIPRLAFIDFAALSVYGPEKPADNIGMINTHVDLIDWHGSRGGRDPAELVADMVRRLAAIWEAGEGSSLGFLTHHLVHDAAAWDFLEALFAVTQNHPACRWLPVSDLVAAMAQD
jgi:peptidoglycan/xylan/chitin deacetylase (PgdA/CDA1 family)